jgi:hypothetical protein
MSFRPSRNATMSFSALLGGQSKQGMATSLKSHNNPLSVRSRSCAAVVNICGGSCGTGGGPVGICC